VFLEMLQKRVPPDQREISVQQEAQDRQVSQVLQEIKVHREMLVTLDPQESQVRQAYKETRV
jgi:hypothetical protein